MSDRPNDLFFAAPRNPEPEGGRGKDTRFPDPLTARKNAYYYLLFICDERGRAAYAKVLERLHGEILALDPGWKGDDE